MKFRIPKIVIRRVKYSEANLVPKKFDDYLSDVNFVCSSYVTDFFHGREKEIERIFTCFMLNRSNNVLLVGDSGVGKKSIIQTAVNRVLREECPKAMKDTHFFTLNLQKVLAIVSSDDNAANKQLSQLFKYLTLEADDVVLVIDQIHLMLYSPTLEHILTQLLYASNVKVIGITSFEGKYDFDTLAPNLLQLIHVIPVLEPELNKIHAMISEYVGILANSHGVTVSDDIIDYAISLSHIIPSEQCNPGRTVQALEKAMVIAKGREDENVTREDFNAALNLDFEFLDRMSEEDKLFVAYHETGHFLVRKMSEKTAGVKTTAVTIVPSEDEDYLGITLFTRVREKQIYYDIDDYINAIAVSLGGRAAEEVYMGESYNPTSCASADLMHANMIAREVVTVLGMTESYKNKTDFCTFGFEDLALLSESKKQFIEKEVQELIDTAYDRAKQILIQHRDLLDRIAHELVDKCILEEKDLDSLCSQVEDN